MKRPTVLRTMVACIVALPTLSIRAPAANEPPDEIGRLQADNKLLKATIAQRDKTIEALKKEVEDLRAEPTQVELDRLRQQLAQANIRIQQLSRELENARPVDRRNLKITDDDLTLRSLDKNDARSLRDPRRAKRAQVVLEELSRRLASEYRGAELLLDGYVVTTDAKDGELRAVIAAGDDGPDGPVLTRISGAKTEYQVQVYLTGDVAAKLRPGDSPRRARGIVRDIKAAKGEMFDRTGLSFLPQTRTGVLIIVSLEDVTVR